MLASLLASFSVLLAPALVGAAPAPVGEQHDIKLENYCGGEAVFKANGDPAGPQSLVRGRLDSGRAWVKGGPVGCSTGPEAANGEGCGLVEFSIFNEGWSAVNYSLQKVAGHDHKFKYNMFYYWTHPQRQGSDICLPKDVGAPGWCKGGTYDQCPGGFLYDATEVGKPVMCEGSNVGLTVVFCPEKAPGAKYAACSKEGKECEALKAAL